MYKPLAILSNLVPPHKIFGVKKALWQSFKQEPPQSIPFSFPFILPSEQVGALYRIKNRGIATSTNIPSITIRPYIVFLLVDQEAIYFIFTILLFCFENLYTFFHYPSYKLHFYIAPYP